jgi:hypothetical protein
LWRNDGSHTFERLQRFYLLGPGRSFEKFADLHLEFALARLVVLKSVQVSLECYLLCRMGKLSVPEPPAMPRAPWLAFEPQVVPKQKRLDADAISPDVLARRVRCPNRLCHCLRAPHPSCSPLSSKNAASQTSAACSITWISYAGDEGGIVCRLHFGDEAKNAAFVSITHLRFDARLPLAHEIIAYQKHRVKRLQRRPA